MTVVERLLTNSAYGFPRGRRRRVKPVALACIHITGNSKTAAYTDLHKAASAERTYANRAASPGPSAHYYVARDGWAIKAIDWRQYAAWSNGDVASPNRDNAGIRRVLALRAKGYNANEAYWLEFENVGFGADYPITAAQRQTCAALIAEAARLSGLPVNRETVHGHWEINGIDRQRCPAPPSKHEAFLADVIRRANAILTPAIPDTSTGDAVRSFIVPEQRTLAKIRDGAWLYMDSSLAANPDNVNLSPSRELVLVGILADVRIVAYEPRAGDVDATSRAMFVAVGDVLSTRVEPDLTPRTDADVTAAWNKALDAGGLALDALRR